MGRNWGWRLLPALHRFYRDQFHVQKMNRLLVNRAVLNAIAAGDDPEHIAEGWRTALEAFEQKRQPALIYPVR